MYVAYIDLCRMKIVYMREMDIKCTRERQRVVGMRGVQGAYKMVEKWRERERRLEVRRGKRENVLGRVEKMF